LGKKQFVYTGRENLEAMAEAVNYNRFLINLIHNQVNNAKTDRILDFGAGSGTYAKMLRVKGLEVDCLEPDKILQSELSNQHFKVIPSLADIKPNTYHVIYALNVFEHLEDDFAEIAKLTSVLRKKGKLIIYVPAFQVLFSEMDKKVGHYRRYRKKRLTELAEIAGLKVEELSYLDPIGFSASFVYKLGKGSGVLNPKSVKIYDKYIFRVSKSIHPISKNILGKNALMVGVK